MTEENPNNQKVQDFVTIYTFILIGILLVILSFVAFFLFVPFGTPLVFQNFSTKEIGANLTPSMIILQSFANEGNTTIIINKIAIIFSSSNISTIGNPNFFNGGLFDLIAANFTIFLALIGALSLYCIFYYEITFNANIISEYPASQQRTLKIFLQILYLLLSLMLIYLTLIIFKFIHIQTVEIALLMLFFILTVLTSALFYDYIEMIRPFYNNMVQFAALLDSRKHIDHISYLNTILCFIFPLILIFYGISADFNYFSIIFVIGLILIMIWQISIINVTPRNIYEIKVKNRTEPYRGFLLNGLDKDIVRVLIDNETNIKIQVPKSSIDYVIFNRIITKSEIINPSENLFHAIQSIWHSMIELKNFLFTYIGFDLGFFVGVILYMIVAVIASTLNLPIHILILILMIIALLYGIVYGRSYYARANEFGFEYQDELIAILKTGINSLSGLKMGFSSGIFLSFAIVIFSTNFEGMSSALIFLLLVIVVIVGFVIGFFHRTSPISVNSENWRSHYAYEKNLDILGRKSENRIMRIVRNLICKK